MADLIGKRISLTSSSLIRYEGVLHAFDMEQVTMTVANVQVFGTEDRSPTFMPPQDTIHPFVVFRGSDVIDLSVVETPVMAAVVPSDPAILQAPSPPQAQPSQQQPQPTSQPPSQPPSQQPAQVHAPQPKPATPVDETPRFVREPSRPNTNGTGRGSTSRGRSQTARGRGARGRGRSGTRTEGARGRGARGRGASGRGRGSRSNEDTQAMQNLSDPLQFQDDFDFAASTAKMSELSLDDGAAQEHVAPAYNPADDFFDSISTVERDERRTHQQERQYNAEAFGQDGLTHRSRGRRRGRGRGRGRRGRGRGGEGRPQPASN
eukprot:m.29505 g.29505  ORF g.29505 m.29505 type:complete len:320 (+) comp11949_c0_seq1:40-999(+)